MKCDEWTRAILSVFRLSLLRSSRNKRSCFFNPMLTCKRYRCVLCNGSVRNLTNGIWKTRTARRVDRPHTFLRAFWFWWIFLETPRHDSVEPIKKVHWHRKSNHAVSPQTAFWSGDSLNEIDRGFAAKHEDLTAPLVCLCLDDIARSRVWQRQKLCASSPVGLFHGGS